MGVYSKVVSAVKPINQARVFIGGTAKDIISGWVFVNGVRKQVFPTTEIWTLVYEKTTAGSDTFAVGYGRYKVEVSAGGGGAGTALHITGGGGIVPAQARNSAGASGGTGAYGSAILSYLEADTLSFTVGARGNGATKERGTASSTGGGNTSLSDTTHGSNFIVLGGGGRGYAHATENGDSASVGAAGTVTTTLATHDLHNGRNGASSSTSTGSHSAGNTSNPSPYSSYGRGGGWSYKTGTSYSQSASNGTAGFIRIYKSNFYPE